MTVFDFINACQLVWSIIRIFTDSETSEEEKDLGSFFDFQDIPEELLQSEVDAWSILTYQENAEDVVEIDILI